MLMKSAASLDGSITTRCLRSAGPLPLLIEASDKLDPYEWARANRQWLAARLSTHGGILLRNFAVHEAAGFERFISMLCGDLLDYTNRSTPRSQVNGKIYTSTEYPANQSIPLHNELSYGLEWPLKIFFLCTQAAQRGGETPIADSAAVYRRIDPQIRARFEEKKVMYTRNYGLGVDLSWQNAFQTEAKAEVEAYCRAAGIEFEWLGADHLRTRQICQAVARHPQTGATVWFNQAHLFHISNLRPEVRESLLCLFKEEDLPRNACYGDGAPIEPAVLDEIRACYEQEAVSFPWLDGDLLILDNMLVAHGRAPFVGPRRVVIGMAELFVNQDR